MKRHPHIFIGIAGPSGSGKSTICKILKRNSKDYECVKLDNYFKDPKTFPRKYGFANWEKPSNLKFNLLLRHLKVLSKGRVVHAKSFPKKPGAKRRNLVLKPKKYILVEGFILFAAKAIREFLDIKIYLDIPVSLMLERRAKRFGTEHITEYDTKVAIPEYLKFGIKQKKFADHVIKAIQPQNKIIQQLKRIINPTPDPSPRQGRGVLN